MPISASARSPRSTSTPACGRRSRFIAAAVLIVTGLGAAGCTEPVPPVDLGTLRILPQIDSFYTGQTTAANPFAVTLFDLGGKEINDSRPITYTSTAPTVFTVDAKTGQVTGRAIGSGLFRATVSGKFIEATVKIIAPVATVQLNTGDFTLNIGQTRQLVPTLVGGDGSSISGRLITYASTNPAVASVSTGGVVTAVSEGTSTITATSEGKSASLVVTVAREVVTSVSLTPPVAQILRLGSQLQVVATPRNAANQPLTGRTVTWFTSNPAVATVSAQGVISAVGIGSATITAEVESRTASLGVTVTEIPAKTVSLDPDAFNLGTGQTRQLAPTVIDSAGNLVTSLNNRQVIWQSSSSSVATVSNVGVVQGVSTGTARISVTVDGVRSNDAVVTVSPQVVSVRILPLTPQLLRIGTTVQLTAQALDNLNQPIPGKVINWITNNPSVASVSSNGLVTGVGVGTTSITAEVDNRTTSLSVQVTLIPVGTVTFTPTVDTLIVGDQRQYNPVVRDTAGTLIPSLLQRAVVYVPSDNLVLSTSSVPAGVIVTAGNTEQTATVTAFVDNVASNPPLSIRVTQVANIQLSASAASIPVNATTQLTLVLKDAANNTLKLNTPRVSYSTSAAGVVQFSSTASATTTGGLTMTLVGKAVGTATITVTVGGATAQIVITVT